MFNERVRDRTWELISVGVIALSLLGSAGVMAHDQVSIESFDLVEGDRIDASEKTNRTPAFYKKGRPRHFSRFVIPDSTRLEGRNPKTSNFDSSKTKGVWLGSASLGDSISSSFKADPLYVPTVVEVLRFPSNVSLIK